jgi:hypothetical protein
VEESRSFTIPASRKSVVEAQLVKLNKRAKKLDLPEITWTWGKAGTEKRHILFQHPDFAELPPQWVEREILVLPIVLSGPMSVAYEGWEFVATIQHLPNAGNIIRAISDEHEIPKNYRDAHSDCEHCQINRYRKDTYLVRHEGGNFVQVGSSCIKDFLGGNSPDNIIQVANFIAELVSFMDGMSEGYGGGSDINYHIHDFLAQTSAVIRDHGWLSKSKALDEQTPTAIHVANNFSMDPPRGHVPSIVTDSDRERGVAATEWAELISDEECDKSDYLYNIRTIARSGLVGHRTMGYAASIMSGYDRYMGEVNKPKNPSQHVGTIKKREIFSLNLVKHTSYDGMYGTSHRYQFHDENGNVLIWKASAPAKMVEGKRYAIKGTVKAHSEWKGVDQTELTRCEVMTTYDSDN